MANVKELIIIYSGNPLNPLDNRETSLPPTITMEKISYQNASFIKSVAKIDQLPEAKQGEVAFIGRSNSGKSSVINCLTNQKRLAKVSKTPGRTQLLNYFAINEFYLVDLPGYGFAKVSQEIKKNWEDTIEKYFYYRDSLKGLILIMDIRHPLKPQDEQMLFWAEHSYVPTRILLNKADKISKNVAINTLRNIQAKTNHASVQLFSALKKQGIDELKDCLTNWLVG